MTYIRGARITNFGPFAGEHELDLGPGCYGIFARHADDPKRSNGCGKTDFTNALRWCLDGKKITGRDALDELITDGEDEMVVELELSDCSYLSRRRARGKATRFELVTVSPETGELTLKDDEAQEELERRLGISADDRDSTCWAVQKELDSLLRRGGDVTRMMLGWMGVELERLESARNRVGRWFDEAEQRHAAAVLKVERLTNEASQVSALEVNVAELQTFFDIEEDGYEAALERWKTRSERENLTARVVERTKLQAENDALGEQLEEDEPKLDEADNLVNELGEKMSAAKGEAAAADRERRRLEVLAKGEFDGRCPVSSGFACPVKTEINERSEPNRADLKKAQANELEKKAEFSGAMGAWEKAVRVREAAREASTRKARRAERKRGVESRLKELDEFVRLAEQRGLKQIGADEPYGPKPQVPDARPLAQAQERLRLALEAEGGLVPARADVEKTSAEVRAHQIALELLANSKRVLLRSAVDGIEDGANRRLAEAGIRLSVRAAWGRETKELATQCPACGSAFPKSAKVKQCERCGAPRGLKVSDEFRWRSSWVSGAGADLAGLALRVSAFDYLKARQGALWAVAVLDEPTMQMDETHRRAVAAGIRKLLVGSFEQAFLSAHDQSTLESCDRRVLITASGDPLRSKIEVL